MSRRRRAKTQGQSLKVAWQDIPWKKVQRHVFRLQKRIYQATRGSIGTISRSVCVTSIGILRSGVRRKSHAPFWSSGRRSDPSIDCNHNGGFIPNYGERYRNGERISTGFVESTVNYVVSKRMVKKQQMRWSQRGAHLLLQIRTRVLNGEWEATFRQWYPGFRAHAKCAVA